MLLEGKRVLVTGGTGSMGKTFVRRCLKGTHGIPSKIIVFSRDEAKQHYMRTEYLGGKTTTDQSFYKNFENHVEFRIGDVRNYGDVCSALQNVDIVINAAALKQVPACEYFPSQAVLTNCVGAENIVRAIREFGFPIETVVGVSTDKACRPVNVMGMTKAVQERIFISANVLSPKTRFLCVRYGNVLASRGSVIPFFHEQLRNGGPLTVTDKKMTRFLLNLEEAVDTVIAAIERGHAGDIFIPIVPAANMFHVASALVGDSGIPVTVTGIRPGEKLYESLVSEEESYRTYRNGEYYVVQSMLPEVCSKEQLRPRDLIGEYASHGDVLDLNGTVKLLKDNDLLIPADAMSEAKELIR